MERWHLNSDLKTEDTAKIPWKEKNFGLFEGKKMRSVWQVISAGNISYPDLLPTRKKKKRELNKKYQRDLNGYFAKEAIQMTNKYEKVLQPPYTYKRSQC